MKKKTTKKTSRCIKASILADLWAKANSWENPTNGKDIWTADMSRGVCRVLGALLTKKEQGEAWQRHLIECEMKYANQTRN